MKRREALGTIGAAAASVLAATTKSSGGQRMSRPPNVILVMTDDQGYGDLGCHGNEKIHTPNLDWLHAHSSRLTDFHVDPTCSPTRSALMTGHYSTRTGVWHTIMGRSLLGAHETTMADVFAANGYRTGIFGKWHLGDNYPFRPQDRGFQEVVVHGGGGVGQTPDFWGNDYFDDTYWHNGKPEAFKGYCTDVFFRMALRFIEANKDRPFFCYIPTNAPHGPYRVPEKYARFYHERGVRGGVANFWGMITNFDENMGRLYAKLRELGLEENTILVFLTDNGTSAGTFNCGMRGKKGSEYRGGHRVPCFIRWPGHLPEGRDFDQLAAHIDLLPTLIELCGLKKPENLRFDGTSLVPLLTGKGQWPERTLFVHSQRIEHPQKWRKCAVMTERWWLINGRELYDIQADPGQKNDIAKEHPDVVKRLREAYEKWWEYLSPVFDDYCYIVLGTDHENPARLTCHDWHTPQVPWNQGMIRRAPWANGFWAVEIARAGRYRFTLRQQPTEANFPIQGDEARLKIGEVEASAPIPKGATGVDLEVELKPGKTRLQTWFTDKAKGKSRGAFFVYVQRLA